DRLAQASGFDRERTASLRQLGELLNYNGYGSELADLHFDPVVLYGLLREYGDPFDFIAAAGAYATLKEGYRADMAAIGAVQPDTRTAGGAIYMLADRPWARRAIGVWANALSQQDRSRAHLIFCPDGRGTYTASVRAPQLRPYGAASFCGLFPGGGGREAAGGITRLDAAAIDEVSTAFQAHFAGV